MLAVTDKLTTGAPHFIEMGHSEQSRLGAEVTEKIKRLAEQAMLAVGAAEGAGTCRDHRDLEGAKGGGAGSTARRRLYYHGPGSPGYGS